MTITSTLKQKLENTKSVEEATQIISKLDNFDIQSLYKKYLNDSSNETLNFLKQSMYKQVMCFRADEQEFLARQEQKWYDGFVTSEMLYIIIIEASNSYSKYVIGLNQDKKCLKQWMYKAMQYIHGRALQEYVEIITLMKNGFADGAFARWRSMYELSIISSFILKYGENVAKAFIDASLTDDRYEWARASHVFDNSKNHITFNDIQKKCDIFSPVWKKQYNLANQIVHASPQGTFSRICKMDDENIIPIGRSDYGITTPAEHSAISLVQITTMFFNIYPFSETVITMECISDWINVIRETYFKAHDEVFPDDDPLWKDNNL